MVYIEVSTKEEFYYIISSLEKQNIAPKYIHSHLSMWRVLEGKKRRVVISLLENNYFNAERLDMEEYRFLFNKENKNEIISAQMFIFNTKLEKLESKLKI